MEISFKLVLLTCLMIITSILLVSVLYLIYCDLCDFYDCKFVILYFMFITQTFRLALLSCLRVDYSRLMATFSDNYQWFKCAIRGFMFND